MGNALQLMAFAAAGIAMYRFAFGSKASRMVDAEGRAVKLKPSLGGWFGRHVTVNLLIAAATGLLGPAVVKAFFAILLIIPMLVLDIKFELPDYLTAWPRAIAYKIQHIFRDKAADVAEAVKDKKEAVIEKFGDVKDAVVSRLKGRKLDSVDLNEMWGGPPDPKVTQDAEEEEKAAFDALPAETKLAALDGAMPLEASQIDAKTAPECYFESPKDHRVRVGRSTFVRLTRGEIEMFRALWTADMEPHAPAEVLLRLNVTRLSTPPKLIGSDLALESFSSLSPKERFAVVNAGRKLKLPVPDAIPIGAGASRDQPHYAIRQGPGSYQPFSQGDLQELRDGLLIQVQLADAVEARGKHDRLRNLAEAAKGKARDASDDLRDKAALAAAGLKERASDAAEEIKDEAVAGVKDGARDVAKGMFWKALGW